MQNYSPQKSQAQMGDPKVLNRRYVRKDKPWHGNQFIPPSGIKSSHEDDSRKLNEIFDQSKNSQNECISVREVLTVIGCEKPWHMSNKRYFFLIKEIRRRYDCGYLGILSEQLETGEPIPFNPYRRSPYRKPPSDSWHPFS
jgi:hypothetical protein